MNILKRKFPILKFSPVYAHTECTHNESSFHPKSSIKAIFVPGCPVDQTYSVYSNKLEIDDLRKIIAVHFNCGVERSVLKVCNLYLSFCSIVIFHKVSFVLSIPESHHQ